MILQQFIGVEVIILAIVISVVGLMILICDGKWKEFFAGTGIGIIFLNVLIWGVYLGVCLLYGG